MNGRVRSLWTIEDEAALVELSSRKDRIMKENRQPLVSLLVSSGMAASPLQAEGQADELIARADQFVDVLTPYCTDQLEITKVVKVPSVPKPPG